MTAHDSGRPCFRKWMGEVDDLCMMEFCMSIHDLPDLPLFDSFESGLSPQEFMRENLPDVDALGALVLR